MSSEQATSQIEVVEQPAKPKKFKKKTLVIVKSTTNKETTIKNKGTGAGGSKTNTNGLPYEELTELNTHYEIKKTHKNGKEIVFNINKDTPFIATKQSNVFKYMDKHMNKSINRAHGCKRPDECFINENTKQIFIIEKKFQQIGGSVCEKIQTAEFKRRHYNKLFPDYDAVYMYCLCDWFKLNCKAELEDLKEINIPVFWGSNETYKEELIYFIINYK
uniref:Uncharacterized protein n=1 Tax=viral metagenome TaxID=1070528 RepID=A0A6C0JWR8_9ZZZZ